MFCWTPTPSVVLLHSIPIVIGNPDVEIGVFVSSAFQLSVKIHGDGDLSNEVLGLPSGHSYKGIPVKKEG